MAEDLIGLILDFQETWPVGSELIDIDMDEGPMDSTDLEALRGEVLAHAKTWADRDAYNDTREQLLRRMLAHVKVALGSPDYPRGLVQRFREEMQAEAVKALQEMLAARSGDQGA